MAQWIEDPQGRQEIEKVTKELKLPVWKANYKGKFREFWNEVWSKIEDNFLNLKNIVENKEPTITKKSGFNLDKTDEYNQDDTNKLGTARALKKLYDFLIGKINAIKLTWDKIENKPSTFPPTSHNHDDRYYTEAEVDTKLNDNILRNTGKDYGGILNNSGSKIAGKVYFDNNTKKLFLCLKNNNDVSANIQNFTPLDNNSLLERLENLLKKWILLKILKIKNEKVEIPAQYTDIRVITTNEGDIISSGNAYCERMFFLMADENYNGRFIGTSGQTTFTLKNRTITLRGNRDGDEYLFVYVR